MVGGTIATPVGALRWAGDGVRLLRAWFDESGDEDFGAANEQIARQLQEYFDGNRRVFEIELQLEGTEFQRAVWAEVARIPFGETRSYLDIANALGDSNLVRAVGAANGANPVAVVIPCHRVVGSDGSLTGYAGGLHRKKWLLDHESEQQSLF